VREKNRLSFVSVVLILCFFYCLSYAQVAPSAAGMPQTKTVDVNKDGQADVTCYHDGKCVNKIEADTNYDGKNDVTVEMEKGKFKSAEADTDHDGKADKKFSNTAAFNQWLNKDRPEFKESLGFSDDGTYTMFRF
jgi:hypothetical protein